MTAIAATCQLPEKRRWPVVDIAYVRENYPSLSAREIALELNVSVKRVQSLVKRLKQRDAGPASDIEPAVGTESLNQTVHLPSASAERVAGNTSAAAQPANRSCGPESAPADLLAFVRGRPVREVARLLGLSVGQVHRIANGYWPPDARRTLAVWHAFKARDFERTTSWFLRRVGPGGVLQHGGVAYTGSHLASREGQLLAVARAADGGLAAVALDLPAERFTLERVA